MNRVELSQSTFQSHDDMNHGVVSTSFTHSLFQSHEFESCVNLQNHVTNESIVKLSRSTFQSHNMNHGAVSTSFIHSFIISVSRSNLNHVNLHRDCQHS